MPAARYWRLTAIETYDYGDLELSEIALYDGASRVDASATLSSNLAPASGTLAALSDVSFGTTARWNAADFSLPGFAIVWDFGASQNIDSAGFAGPAQATFVHRYYVSYSADGITWTLARDFPSRTKWLGAGSIFTRTLVATDGDAFAANVALLLNGDGVDGSTSIVDSSVHAHTVSVFGNAQIDTDQKFDGSGSILFDGAGDYLSIPTSAEFDFGSGDFTVEFFYRPGAVGLNQCLLNYGVPNSLNAVDTVFRLLTNTNNNINATFFIGAASVNTGAPPFALGQGFYHFAFQRRSSTLETYVDQALVSEIAISGALNTPASRVLLLGASGTSPVSNPVNGHIDSLRITKGVARYTRGRVLRILEQFDIATALDLDPTPDRVRLPAPSATIVEAPVLDFSSYESQGVRGYYDQEDGGDFRIVGTVKEVALPVNTPLSRRVRLSYQDNGRVIREGFSDAAGNYSFDHIRGDRPFVVVAFDHTDTYRAVVADKLQAEPMP